MKNVIFHLIFLVVFLPLTCPVFAGELLFIKGEGVPVCEAHFNNLKSLRLYEMVCQRNETYPKNNGITRPKWDKMELTDNTELIKRIHKFLSYGDQFAPMEVMDDEKQFKSLFDTIYSKSHTLWKSMIDLDNDGITETAILYTKGFCMETHVYSRPLLVLDNDKNQIDVENTTPLLQNVGLLNTTLKTKTVESIYRLYDVFVYHNTTYFDRWNAYDLTLSVYSNTQGNVKEVCKYKYIDNANTLDGGKDED